MLPGASGWSWIPRKMSGREMSKIDWLMVTIRMPRVVFDSAIHLYRSGRLRSPGPGGEDVSCSTVMTAA